MRSVEEIQEEISTIHCQVAKVERSIEQTIDALRILSVEDDQLRWLELRKRVEVIQADLRIAENKRLKPLQAEYAQAWHKKWR